MDYKYPNWAMYYDLPRQIEDKDDLVVVANHYIVPEMYLTISHAVNDSLWRYETLTSLILDSYGKIDVEKGRSLLITCIHLTTAIMALMRTYRCLQQELFSI